ncbi:MAG: hypothetical protein C0402_15115 [Thermodesulfovibrio sp.]|nr:hypothetical protein [Thermodesulfovibrio sp.]
MIFRTAYFNAGADSVLHSGIYNREFSSMLGSLGVASLAYAAISMSGGPRLAAFAALVSLALVSFPFFRRYIFREHFLTTAFDKKSGRVQISREGLVNRILAGFPLSDIRTVLIRTKKTSIENTDGVDFVKKISLQHHTAIPGFGEETSLFMLTLTLADGTNKIIFADTCMQDVIEAHGRVQNFLDIQSSL